jgi:hypothetical protein
MAGITPYKPESLAGSNSTFIDYLYQNLLGRKADEGGQKYWLDKLESGESTQDSVRTSVLRSKEYNAPYVNNLYSELLGRKADEGGMNFWLNSLEKGTDTQDSVRMGLQISPEGLTRGLGNMGGGFGDMMRLGIRAQNPPKQEIFSSAGADGSVGASGFRSKKSSWKTSGQSTKGTNNLKLQMQKGASGTGLNISG